MNMLKDKNKRNGIITTVLVHVLVLVIFIFTGLTIPVPLPEQGIVIDFGTSEEGSGDVQPDEVTTTEATENPDESVIESSIKPTGEEEEIITQNTEEAPAVNNESSGNIENEADDKEPDPVVDPAALYTGKTSKTNAGSEGETGESGDQGKIDGTPGSKNYNQPGGSGKGFYLSGREIVFKPVIKESTQETGKVVVSIWVDRYGKVTRAASGAKGSTTSDSHLYKIAQEAALKAKFSADPDAPEIQKGTIVFEFKVRE
ncbi:MAG: energy transducer TonB [Bacteroidota bacterium]